MLPEQPTPPFREILEDSVHKPLNSAVKNEISNPIL